MLSVAFSEKNVPMLIGKLKLLSNKSHSHKKTGSVINFLSYIENILKILEHLVENRNTGKSIPEFSSKEVNMLTLQFIVSG